MVPIAVTAFAIVLTVKVMNINVPPKKMNGKIILTKGFVPLSIMTLIIGKRSIRKQSLLVEIDVTGSISW